jgi:hypothetical protein
MKYRAFLGCLLLAGGFFATVNVTSASSGPPKGTHIRAAQVTQTIMLAPGATGFVSGPCAATEAVTGGGPTDYPASLTVAVSTLFFDGTRSGWSVDWKNNGPATVTETVAVTALCVSPGYMTS